MTSGELRKKYLEFFVSRGHKIIPSAPLVPENDPSTLFVSAGMQPMLPYLLGEKSPYGPRVADSQKCVRTADIEEVGDNRHQTFFEMLGNWSFGDYFKKEQLPWIFEFLTKEVGLDPRRIYVTIFAGDEKYNLPKDTESVEIWKELFAGAGVDAKDVELGSLENAAEKGLQEGKIFYYDQRKNWWTRSCSIQDMPAGEPGGPCSEMFYEFPEIEHDPKYGKHCHPNCNCGRFLEFGNSVFMQYQKQADGTLREMSNKNVDYGGGLERLTMVHNDQPDVFQTDLFLPAVQKIKELSGKNYDDCKKEFRIIADHLRAAVFLILDGVEPSNKERGYVVRRIIRRAILQLKKLGVTDLEKAGKEIVEVFTTDIKMIQIIEAEIKKFGQTLDKGLKEFNKLQNISGKDAFNLFQTYGFPLELTEELAQEKGLQINKQEFEEEFKKHQELSRTASAGMFKGGLGEQSEVATRYHTATHLLHAALRQILGEHVQQKGSNITAERLRFDFSQPEKVTEEQLKQIENLVNEKIKENLQITSEVMDKNEALQSGALGFFTEKYGDRVTVYTIGDPSTLRQAQGSRSLFSREICGGPHAKFTGELGKLKIIHEEGAGAGIRRIYATLSS